MPYTAYERALAPLDIPRHDPRDVVDLGASEVKAAFKVNESA